MYATNLIFSMCRPILKSTSTVENKYRSQYSVAASGPNTQLRKGPKEGLLL